ncbi:acetamidase/formamidase family protein [Kutzneria kofuensis]|uniref:Acetamidase/formamidase n=2 Tax=Kutzneria kofuensis TaxID=103725 RepID=A0A7W9KBF7_9PSEU|nr:acetamidase/formamidase family protein [Kutzneria kofuensis]MBB5889529.1 acetamidase/formamidase [Kutzneria kofuensis]
MAEHRLDPSADTVTDVFDRDRPPVLTVDPGDTLIVRSLNASGHLGDDVHGPKLIPDARGHCLTGPIAVRGAEPGMMLAVRLESLQPDNWGYTVSVGRDTPLNRRLKVFPGDMAWLHWDIADGNAVNNLGFGVRLAPFLGVIGLPPDEPGEHSTTPPRPCGGNIDCRELVAGSTLYLPITVPEALLCLGDGHGAQGDGEVCGTAVECGMTTRLVLDLVSEPPIRTAHAITPAGRVTFGFDADLNEASAQALSAMLDWMEARYGVDRATALALASPVVDLRITQVANTTWGVHAVLPDGALTGG